MHRGITNYKPKDFKGSMKRLLKELKRYQFLVILSLFLSVLGCVLTILAPDQLSNLTNEISDGIIPNRENLNLVINHLKENLDEKNIQSSLQEILSLDLSYENLSGIMASNEYTPQEKEAIQNIFQNQTLTEEERLAHFSQLSDSLLKVFVKDSTYQGILISANDKIAFLRNLQAGQKNIPTSILSCFLTELKIDDEVISVQDEIAFLNLMQSMDLDNSDMNIVYQKIQEAPLSIQKVIEPVMNMNRIIKIVLILVSFYVISAIFTYIEAISMTVVSNRFAKFLRKKISIKINRLPLKFFDQHQAGDILSRVTNDVDMIAQSMDESLSTLVSATTLFLGTTLMMFVTNWVMAITAIGASLFGFLFMGAILGKSQKYFIERQKKLGDLNSHIEEIYSGLNVVKAYNGEKEAVQEFEELNDRMYECNRKSQFLSGLMMPMMHFVGNFGYVAVCIVGSTLTMNESISFGVIIAFISYVRLFTSPLSQIAQGMTRFQSIIAASERVFEFLDEKEMTDETSLKKVLRKDEVKGNIEFRHVNFQYEGNETPTIYDFNATVKSGEKIAIVGPTGAGKTTMVNLLMKFYEISDGDILIDGVSTKELTRENIHDLFTMVLQDTWLFSGTVKENIKYNRQNVSDEKVKEVCKVVGLDHFIRTLPNGYDSILNDQESVSSGQKQLLTIARGMIEDSPFLILDEATSNVDTRTEELVSRAMDELTKGKTSFIIAHRLSTIKNADLILVMKDGNIIEQGTHESLMKKNGFYKELYNSQFEL